MSDPPLRLYTFGPAWGLPTLGPFGLKLEACLRMLDLPYERVVEDDPRKGPKGKSPWIEDGDVRMGDTECILQYLGQKHGVELDRDLSPAQRARGHVLRRALEEHFHQVLQYELTVDDRGWAEFRTTITRSLPGPLVGLLRLLVRSGLRRQLVARGIARHAPADVAAMGRADLDALAEMLGDHEWFLGDRPTKVDASAFGLLAVAICSNLPTPVCSYARTLDPLVRFVDRARAQFVPHAASGAVAAPAGRGPGSAVLERAHVSRS